MGKNIFFFTLNANLRFSPKMTRRSSYYVKNVVDSALYFFHLNFGLRKRIKLKSRFALLLREWPSQIESSANILHCSIF